MKRYSRIMHASMLIFLFASCATIVSKSRWPVTLQTTPSNAKVVITNRKNVEVFNGNTPVTVKLKSGASYFRKESYTVMLSMDGYETNKVYIECKLNGWYFGNLVFGGLIGFLIVDPASGSMYRLASQDVDAKLVLKTALRTGTPSLHIVNMNQVPASWHSRLVKLEQ